MCVIIDNDIIAKVVVHNDSTYLPVLKSLFRRKHFLKYGGKLKDEYYGNHQVRKKIIELDKAGIAQVVPTSEIDLAVKYVIGTGLCKSNDSHILGLARACCARILCTKDGNLQKDFTNIKLVNNPKGKVYKNPDGHSSLVRDLCKCKSKAKSKSK